MVFLTAKDKTGMKDKTGKVSFRVKMTKIFIPSKTK